MDDRVQHGPHEVDKFKYSDSIQTWMDSRSNNEK